MAISKLYVNEEEMKGIKEIERLQYNQQRHYKVVRTKRKGIALGLAAVIALGIGVSTYARNNINIGSKEKELSQMVKEPQVDMVRYYTIKFGDTLTSISKKTGIPQSKIQSDNGIIDPNKIYTNQNLQLVYSVNADDLKYYTNEDSVNGRNIYEIAGEYNTTPFTLYKINEDNITSNLDGSYSINSETISVPNFITPEELASVKGNKK